MKPSKTYTIMVITTFVCMLILDAIFGWSFFKEINLSNAFVTAFVGYAILVSLEGAVNNYETGDEDEPGLIRLLFDIIKDGFKNLIKQIKNITTTGWLVLVVIFLILFAEIPYLFRRNGII